MQPAQARAHGADAPRHDRAALQQPWACTLPKQRICVHWHTWACCQAAHLEVLAPALSLGQGCAPASRLAQLRGQTCAARQAQPDMLRTSGPCRAADLDLALAHVGLEAHHSSHHVAVRQHHALGIACGAHAGPSECGPTAGTCPPHRRELCTGKAGSQLCRGLHRVLHSRQL